MFGPISTLLVSLLLMIAFADRLVLGASNLARIAGVPPLLVGLSLVAFGTSAPEIIVSLMASLSDSRDIALGNVVGSNITNIALVIGLSALLRPIQIGHQLMYRQLPYLILVTAIITLWMQYRGITPVFGWVLLLLGAGFLGLLTKAAWSGNADATGHIHTDALEAHMRIAPALIWLAIGLIGLPFAADYFVGAAADIARALGVSELIIGITLVAFGTSLPELVTVCLGIWHKQDALALGSIVGSNVINSTVVLAPVALFATPGPIPLSMLHRDLMVMVSLTMVLTIFSYSRHSTGRISRLEGAALLLFYAGYLTIVVLQG